MSYLKAFLNLLKDTFKEWTKDGAPRLAAALAYYTAFSLAPLLIVLIAILGFVLDANFVQAEIIKQVEFSINSDAAGIVTSLIDNTTNTAQGVLSSIIGLVTLLLGAIGVFDNLQSSLDIIWNVSATRSTGTIRGFVRDKLLSFGMILVVGFLLLVSLVASTLLNVISEYFVKIIPSVTELLAITNFLLSFGIITFLFMLIYKYLPHAQIAWRDVLIGAGMTALLFTIGKTVLGWYLGYSAVSSAYGAAGAFVVILLWVYYSSQILLFGAEFTQVYSKQYGSKIVADDYEGNEGKASMISKESL